MNIADLEKQLMKIEDAFSDEIDINYKPDDESPATKADIFECHRQTYYALSGFRKAVIEYLRSTR